MSGTTSILPDVKARLVELLEASTDLNDVDIAWCPPANFQREVVYFARTVGTSEVANMRAGRKARDETVTMTLVISTAEPGKGGEDAERRCFELWAVVESLLADDISLIGAHGDDVERLQRIPGVLSVEVQEWTAGPDPDIEGWTGLLVAQIRVTARLN